jgi:hypothetical protein
MWEIEGIAPPFLTLALDGGEWSASRPSSYTPRGNRPRCPLGRRLDEPQRRSGRCWVEKNLAPAGKRTPTVQPVARRYTDWAVRALQRRVSWWKSRIEEPLHLLPTTTVVEVGRTFRLLFRFLSQIWKTRVLKIVKLSISINFPTRQPPCTPKIWNECGIGKIAQQGKPRHPASSSGWPNLYGGDIQQGNDQT